METKQLRLVNNLYITGGIYQPWETSQYGPSRNLWHGPDVNRRNWQCWHSPLSQWWKRESRYVH